MPCLCLEVCAVLLSCWRSLSSGPGYLLHFSPTGTHSPVARLAPSPPGYLQYLFQELYLQISNFSPSWPLSSQLISKNKNRLVPAILHSCWRSLSRWCVASLSSRMPAPFSLTEGSSPVEALPLSLLGYVLPFSLVGPLYPVSA